MNHVNSRLQQINVLILYTAWRCFKYGEQNCFSKLFSQNRGFTTGRLWLDLLKCHCLLTHLYNRTVNTKENISKKFQLTNHNPGWDGVPFQPKCDEWWRNQNDARYKDSCEVEGSVPSKPQFYHQTAVITCTTIWYKTYKFNKII